jgi:DNA-binding LytR/AlgR family response regulator
MLRAALCDDFQEHRDAAKALINQYQSERPGIEISASLFTSGNQLLDHLAEGNNFDLYLLDIIMPGIGGMELARQIRRRDANVPIVFLTNSPDYALEAFNVSAVQYIVKPISNTALFPVLDKIIAARKIEEEKFILISTSDNRVIKVIYSSIAAVERVGRIMRFYLVSGEMLESKTIRASFREAVAQLLRDERFLHPHQSFVVNMSHICELRSCSFILKMGITLPIPRQKYAGVKNRYLKYLSQTGGSRTKGNNDEK